MPRLCLTAVVLLALSLAPAAARSAETDRALVDQVMAEAVADFAGQTLDPDQRAQRLRQLIDRFGDTGLFARDMLGRYWRRLPPDRQAAFASLLGRYLEGCWSSTLTGVPASLSLDLAASENTADGRVVIHSLATIPDDTLAIDWTIARTTDGRTVVADVAVDGMSVLKTMKDDITAVLRGNGGDVDQVIAGLEAKLAGRQGP
jgi:ABC-type transporter MlaC component